MNGKLDAIGGQLSSLQNEVEAMHDDLKRLTGRPVLEEIRENVERRYKKQSMHLRQHVFIDPTCCGENPSDGTFVPREKENNKKTVVVDAFKEFMKRTDKNILLLSGSAGSGKTTAVEGISSQCTVTTAAQSNSFPPSFTSVVAEWIVMQYETSKERLDIVRKLPVVLIPVPLPFANPIGDVLLKGSNSSMDYATRKLTSCEKIFAGEVEVVFILDIR